MLQRGGRMGRRPCRRSLAPRLRRTMKNAGRMAGRLLASAPGASQISAAPLQISTTLQLSTTLALRLQRPAPPPQAEAEAKGGGGGLSRGAADEEQLLNSRTLACLLDGPCAPPRCRGVAPLAPPARTPLGAAGGGSQRAASASAAAPATAGAAPTARAVEVASSWQA